MSSSAILTRLSAVARSTYAIALGFVATRSSAVRASETGNGGAAWPGRNSNSWCVGRPSRPHVAGIDSAALTILPCSRISTGQPW